MARKRRNLTENEVHFSIHITPEDMEVRGNAQASGDDTLDKEAEDAILSDLEAGNLWAWCHVEVRAEYGPFKGSDYLGGCSYKSEADFKADGGYYQVMKRAALAALNAEIEYYDTEIPRG